MIILGGRREEEAILAYQGFDSSIRAWHFGAENHRATFVTFKPNLPYAIPVNIEPLMKDGFGVD